MIDGSKYGFGGFFGCLERYIFGLGSWDKDNTESWSGFFKWGCCGVRMGEGFCF